MDVRLSCPHCGSEWSCTNLTCDAAIDVADKFANDHLDCESEVRPLQEVDAPAAAMQGGSFIIPLRKIEELHWSLNLTSGRLLGSHHAADCSLMLYKVWHDGVGWQAATIAGLYVGDGSLTECLDACQEQFTDDRERDAAGRSSEARQS